MSEFKSETIDNTTYALGCSRVMAIEILREINRQKRIVVGRFKSKVWKEISNQSSYRVIDGRAKKELREAFKEGEEIGRESMRILALEILEKEFAVYTTDEKETYNE